MQSFLKNIHTWKFKLSDSALLLRREADTNIKAEEFILASQSVSVLPWVSKH